MSINPEKAIEIIDSLHRRIEEISVKEYDGDTTVKEFGELVIDIRSFVRNSGIKHLKDQDWYFEYCEFDGWTRDGVPVGGLNAFYDRPTVNDAYESDIRKLKTILNGCRKEFKMILNLKGEKTTQPTEPKKDPKKFIEKFLPIAGDWKIEKIEAKYKNPDQKRTGSPYGIVLLDEKMKNGTIKATVRFEKDGGKIARVIYGYDSKTKSYYSVGIGGYDFAYLIDIFKRTEKGERWQGLAFEGNLYSAIKANRYYKIEVIVAGLRMILKIDGVEIFDFNLPESPKGDQIGLFTWGKGGAIFKHISVERFNPKAFVIMKFNEPFDSLYKKSIKNVCNSLGIDAYRADEVYKPGIVLNDIIKGIAESEVLIADITPQDHVENVYYEVGFAHALGKQTILLAEKNSKIPFDIQGYRVIFYDKEKKGKLEEELKKHLSSVIKSK